MFIGILCAIGAGLMWGLVFVAPLMLPDYPGIVLSFGRYVAFGLISLAPAFFNRRQIAGLSKADWVVAFKLSLVGNLLYYAALATAIQLADAPLPTMLIGTLPVAIAVCSNWAPGHASEAVAWRLLVPSLFIIFVGLMLVNASELGHLDGKRSIVDYALGCLIGLVAVACWTWYPIMNARHMKANPHIASSTWASAQGLATLPMALAGFAGYGLYAHLTQGAFAFPLGPRPGPFLGLMLVMGLCASWLGAVLGNRASRRLPTTLAAQLIVFETLAALLYAFIWNRTMPPLQVLIGIAMLCIGVLWGMRVFRLRPA